MANEAPQGRPSSPLADPPKVPASSAGDSAIPHAAPFPAGSPAVDLGFAAHPRAAGPGAVEVAVGIAPDALDPSPPDRAESAASPEAVVSDAAPPPGVPPETAAASGGEEPSPAYSPYRPESASDDEDEEEGGGPVKPFLDHLEDLRWTLIKVVVSLLLGMLVCLVAGNRLVTFLTWPLNHAQRLVPASHQRVPLLLGTNEVGRVQLGSIPLPNGPVDTNRITALELVPAPLGDRLVLTLGLHTNRVAGQAENLVVLKNYGPLSAFMVALKLALYGGLVVSAPFVIFFIGQFVLPALKVKEKAFVYRVAGYGSVLFVAGVAFCYLVIVQVALMASVQFSQWMGFTADEWRAEDYVSFVCKFMLGMGLSFQLPLVILTLVKVGLVDYQTLTNYRAYFIVGNLTLSAVITPSGDPFTMVLMALPLQVLYEGSLLVARRWARKERARELAEERAAAGGARTG